MSDKKKISYPTIRFEGPEVRPGRMRLDDFWENLTAEEYAQRQGVTPVADTAVLYGEFTPEDWEGFDEELQSWRSGHWVV